MFEFERVYYVNVVGDNAICILYIKRPLYRNQTKAIRFYGVSVAHCTRAVPGYRKRYIHVVHVRSVALTAPVFIFLFCYGTCSLLQLLFEHVCQPPLRYSTAASQTLVSNIITICNDD